MSQTAARNATLGAPIVDRGPIATSTDFTFRLKSILFDESYRPSDNTRATTNFANLARGENRQENLRNALTMIDNRCNALAHWDNPKGDRYGVELEIISVDVSVNTDGAGDAFPVGSSRVDLQACKLEYSIVSPK